jgi:glucosamine-phosphate N-acetyltransferase
MSENYLFSTDLVLPKVQETLPSGYKFRPLERSDFNNGHLTVLADLCYMGEISEEQWVERFDLMKKLEGTYYILVVVDESGKIVGTGSLMVEKKL